MQTGYLNTTACLDYLKNLPYRARLYRLSLFGFTYRKLREEFMKDDKHGLQKLFDRRISQLNMNHGYSHSRDNYSRYFFALCVFRLEFSTPLLSAFAKFEALRN